MTERPPHTGSMSVELEALAQRACAAAGTDLVAALDAARAPESGAGAPEALRAGWGLLDTPQRWAVTA